MPIKLPEDITYDDACQWLNDGYCLHNGKVAAFSGGVTTDEDGYCVNGEFYNGVTHYVAPLGEVECFWPICGMINHERAGMGHAIYVERQQRRQWRRTLNDNCVTLHTIGRWAHRKHHGGTPRPRLSIAVVKELLDPTYYAVNVAIRKIQARESISVALSPQVAITGDSKGVFGVYYREVMVGKIERRKFTPLVESGASQMAMALVKEAVDVS